MSGVRWFVLATVVAVAVFSTTALRAQENGPQRGRFQGGVGGVQAGFGGGDGGAGLLMMEQVRKELELVDEQLEKIRAIQRESGEQMRDLFAGMRDLSEEERRDRFANLRERMETAAKATQAKIEEVLMPHQRDRLKQITLQMQMRRGGGTVNAEAVSSALGLTDAQRDELREREQKVAAELREKIQQAQKEAQAQLLEVLTSEQRAKLEQMLGEPFELQFGQRAAGAPGAQRGPGGRPRGGNN